MYKIPTARLDVDAHFADVSGRVRELMRGFLEGNTFQTSYRDDVTAIIRVSPDTTHPTLTRRWLQRCVDSNAELRRLLCGDFDEQMSLIREVYADNPNHFKREFNSNAPATIRRQSEPRYVDSFHELFRHIFVERMFEGKYDEPAPMRKTEFIEHLHLRLCPYCGDTIIGRSARYANGNIHVVDPELDHFLPKSIYPFLALNCFNLIPSCHACNAAPNKGTADPLGNDKKHEYLMNPYCFRDSAYEFDYVIKGGSYYDSANYEVLFDYTGNADLPVGYQGIMTTESHYKLNHPYTVGKIYRSFISQANNARQLYKGVHIPVDYWDNNVEGILQFPLQTPFDLDEEAYKLKKDLFEKMRLLDWDKPISLS